VSLLAARESDARTQSYDACKKRRAMRKVRQAVAREEVGSGGGRIEGLEESFVHVCVRMSSNAEVRGRKKILVDTFCSKGQDGRRLTYENCKSKDE